MQAQTYFNKYHVIYGIEQPEINCGYSTKIIKFTNLEQAINWKNQNSNNYRFLGTKSDMQHANLKTF